MTDPFCCQRERPTATNLQMSDSNKDVVLSPQMDVLFQDNLADGHNFDFYFYSKWFISQADVVQEKFEFLMRRD
jgi:hypothetical protein